jgi:LppX_LprAFG lipoprotein
MTGSDWNDDTQGEQAADGGEQHLPSEPAASQSAYASWPQDAPPGVPAANQGVPPGYQGPPPGGQGVPPGYQGPPPGYQGAPPGGQGVPPGYQGPPPGYQGPTAGAWQGPGGPSDTVQFGDSTPSPSPRPRRRIVVATAAGAVAAVAVAAIAVAATGGFSSSQTPAQVLSAAAHNSATLSSLSATYSEQISGAASASITGSVQEIRKPLQMTIGMTETADGESIPLSAILTGSNMYLKFGNMAGLPSQLAGKWIKFSLSSVDGGEFSSLLQSVENENPTSQTQELLAAKDLRADGTQVIDGVQTNRYVGSFTPAAALKVLSPSERKALGPAMKEIHGKINFSVWIDSNDHIRQVTEKEAVASETVNATFTFSKFNQPVTVTIPPASQIVQYPASGF